jgi:phage shock protein A
MRINSTQYAELMNQLTGLTRAVTQLSADNAALKAQLGEVHGRITKSLDKMDELHERISLQRRPRS